MMNWEEKLLKLRELSPMATVRWRGPNSWYVSAGMHKKEGQIIVGAYGNGTTPEEAVENHWDIYSHGVGYLDLHCNDAFVLNGDKWILFTGKEKT